MKICVCLFASNEVYVWENPFRFRQRVGFCNVRLESFNSRKELLRKRIKLLSRVALYKRAFTEKIALSNSIDTFSSKCQIERERGAFAAVSLTLLENLLEMLQFIFAYQKRSTAAVDLLSKLNSKRELYCTRS